MRTLLLVAAALLLAACATEPPPPPVDTAKVTPPEIPGYELMKVPDNNPLTQAKVDLGKTLYHDKRLSADGTRSCYSCHLKEKGLTDGLPTAIGALEAKLPRSSPTMWNIGFHSEFYWDGRAKALEAQIRAAWTGPNMGVGGKEKNRPSVDEITAKINAIPGYNSLFQKAYGGPATPDNIVQAIACFVRTIVIPKDSKWLRFRSGDATAFSEEAQRGWKIFSDKAKCTNCHDGLLLTDQQYHNTGVGMDAEKPDVGRFTVTKDEKDTGAFKTPTLLDISKSGPYFHNGSVATLEEAVDLMASGGKKNKFLDTKNLKPVKLSEKEKADLLAFLRSLDADYTVAEPPMPQ
jgi:cytochrome c peroxidase